MPATQPGRRRGRFLRDRLPLPARGSRSLNTGRGWPGPRGRGAGGRPGAVGQHRELWPGHPQAPWDPGPATGAWGACSRLRSGRGVVSLVTVRPGRTPPRHRGARATALLLARAVSCAAPAPATVPAPLGRPGVGGHGEQGRDGIQRGTHSPPRGPGPRPVRAAAHRGGALGSGRGLPVTGSRAAAGARLVSRYRAVSGPPLGSRRLSARDSAGRAAR